MNRSNAHPIFSNPAARGELRPSLRRSLLLVTALLLAMPAAQAQVAEPWTGPPDPTS
jgi:hypothetical protein